MLTMDIRAKISPNYFLQTDCTISPHEKQHEECSYEIEKRNTTQ